MVFLRVLIVIAIPVVSFLLGSKVMAALSDWKRVETQLRVAPKEDREPLYQRWGYDVESVQRHWSALDNAGIAAYHKFLELDLLFPFLYGGALAMSLLLAWSALGKPFNPAWLILPVGITVVADWTENLIQLTQIRRWLDGGGSALQAGWIQFASAATMIKLAGVITSALFVVVLAGWVIFAAFRRV